jgi:hypothetical protein
MVADPEKPEEFKGTKLWQDIQDLPANYAEEKEQNFS